MLINHYHLIFIILYQLFNVLVYGQNYIPEPRTGNTAVLVDSELKIYFIGGDNFNKLQSEQDPENEFFYLNIDTNSEWVDLKIQGVVGFPHTFSPIADIGGVNQDSIFIIGGAHLVDENNTDYFYKFDIETNELSIPEIQGEAPPIRIGMKSVSYEGKIYMFGGRTFSLNESLSTYVDQFDILDTINLNWQTGDIDNSPVTLSEYTATLVGEIIYYIGGRSHNHVFSPMTKIFQYNIAKDKWSLKKATIDHITPGPRIGHSAVLFDDKIYVYGGSFFNDNTTHDVPAKETFVILDTTTLIWSIPQLNDTKIPKLAYHTASLNKTLLIIAFGKFTDLPDTTNQNNNSTYYFYLNHTIISWNSIPLSRTKTLPSSSVSVVPKPLDTLTTLPETSITASSQNTINKAEIVGISFGLVSVIMTMSVVNLFIYKRMRMNSSSQGL